MLIIFFILISISLSFTPEWNLTSSGIDLLSSTNKYEYIVYQHKKLQGKDLTMNRTITLNNGATNVKNIIYFGEQQRDVTNHFDNIQNSNLLAGAPVICPYGSFLPYYYGSDSLNPVKINNFDPQLIKDSRLKCIWHSKSLQFYVGYFG